MLTVLLSAAVFCFFSYFSAAAAEGDLISTGTPIQEGVKIIEEPLGLPVYDIRLIIARIIRAALGLLGIVMVVLTLYAGFLWMTAGGNEEQIGRAKKILRNAVIGLAIILSAYAITLFIFKLLGIDTSGLMARPEVGAPAVQNFRGSGALGRAVKDHYPGRDQLNVPRNTKIVVTFYHPVRAESLITDTNNNGVFGDCVNQGPNMDWGSDCDQARLDNNRVSVSRAVMQEGEQVLEPIAGLAALASYVIERDAPRLYTIVFRPLRHLGSSEENVSYVVRLGKAIQWDDEANGWPAIFNKTKLGDDYYEWRFTCGRELDTDPPRVNSVYPANKATVAKNSAIQIDFNEPIDPTGVQGGFRGAGPALGGHYEIANGYVFLRSDNSGLPVGNFRLTNGYRTLEFASTLECGVNACGGKMFCLPVCDKPAAACVSENNKPVDNYELLLRAASALNDQSFEALPFSGIMDLAGNALDSEPYEVVNRPPAEAPVFPNQLAPDNYFWKFRVKDEIDATAPHLRRVTPGLDAENVLPDGEWKMEFSKRMLVEPMYGISIDEYPSPVERCAGQRNCEITPLWKVPRVTFDSRDNFTFTTMLHGPFLNMLRQYYLPSLTSEVTDVNYNCFYPGMGPGGVDQRNARLPRSRLCGNGQPGGDCCDVRQAPLDNPSATLCCNGLPGTSVNRAPNAEACLNYWKQPVNSP